MSNLLKQRLTNVETDNTRILNSNALFVKRLEEIEARAASTENQGFVAGLQADPLDIDSLLMDEDGEAPFSSVIKANADGEIGADALFGSFDGFGSFDATENMASAQALANAKDQAQEIIEQAVADANAQAEAILQQAQQDADQIRQEAADEGRRQGMQEAKAKMDREMEQMHAALAQEQEQQNAAYEELFASLEPALVDTITKIYEQIFQVELGKNKEILHYLISSTMQRVEENKSFLIHVSKADYASVVEQKQSLLSGISENASVDIIEDVMLSENQCMVETSGGIFDCGLGTQLQELAAKLRVLAFDPRA